MGSMRERQPGRWELRVYAGRDPDGRKRWISRTHRGGKRSAAKALTDLEAQLAQAPPQQGMTVGRLLDRYASGRSVSWSPTTARNHRQIIETHLRPTLGERIAEQLRPIDIEDALAPLAHDRPTTARKALAVLRAAFEDGLRWEVVDRNPARLARLPQPQTQERTAPTLAAVARAIEQADADGDQALAVLVRLAVITGCRRGELVALRWADLDLDAATLVVSRAVVTDGRELAIKATKTGRVKTLALDVDTVAVLRGWRRACRVAGLAVGHRISGDSFVWSRGFRGVEPWWPDTVTHRWRALADRAGLAGVRFHDLRHAMVTELVAAGFDARTAADRAGHSSTTVTLGVYAHAVPARDREAAEHLGRLLGG